MSYGDVYLAIAVRLRNKANNLIEWGNIYYKRLILIPNSDITSKKEILEKMIQEIDSKSVEEKLEFILNYENKILKKPYAKSSFVNNELTSFFENMHCETDDGFSIIPLNQKLNNEVLSSIDSSYNDIMANIQGLNSQKIKF